MLDWLFSTCRNSNSQSNIDKAFDYVETLDEESLSQLLKQGFNPNVRNPEGFTLLHAAVLNTKINTQEQMLTLINLLLQLGADPNLKYEKNKWNFSPLHSAVRRNLPLVVATLLDHKSDVTLKDKKDKTPKDYALENFERDGDEDIITQFKMLNEPDRNLNNMRR